MTQVQALENRVASHSHLLGRLAAFLYGIAAYLVFFATFLFAIGFVEDLVVPATLDGVPGAPASPLAQSVIVNLVLMSIFAIQHSVMARPGFKRWWTRFVPASVERTTFVLTKEGKIAETITGVAPDKNVEQALEAVQHLTAQAH